MNKKNSEEIIISPESTIDLGSGDEFDQDPAHKGFDAEHLGNDDFGGGLAS